MTVLLAIPAVIVAFCYGLHLAATFDIRKPLEHRNFLRDTTPAHYQGRQADFDSHGRVL